MNCTECHKEMEVRIAPKTGEIYTEWLICKNNHNGIKGNHLYAAKNITKEQYEEHLRNGVPVWK